MIESRIIQFGWFLFAWVDVFLVSLIIVLEAFTGGKWHKDNERIE